MKKRLFKSRTDKKIAGVAGGIAEFFDIDSTIIRIIFLCLFFAGTAGFWIYAACWLVMRQAPYRSTQQ